MKYSIIRTCGHVETVVIYGSSKERENRISIEKTKLCERCRISAAVKKGYDLIGTPKQIAWGYDIREIFSRNVKLHISKAEGYLHTYCEQHPEQAAHCQEIFNKNVLLINKVHDYLIRTKNDASWWINNRDIDWLQLIKATLKSLERNEEG